MAVHRYCDGIPRRDFLQLGLRGTLGYGLAGLMRLKARAADAPAAAAGNVNCIMIWLDGGPSHYETFDPKPDAPSEIRGEFKPDPDLRPRRAFQRAGEPTGRESSTSSPSSARSATRTPITAAATIT